MKLLYSFLALSLLFISCSKEDNTESKADFSVLGINYLDINGQRIPIKNCYFLDVSNQSSFGITGTSCNNQAGTASVNCVVRSPYTTNDETVKVNSKYADIVILVEETLILKGKKVSVKVSRTGYKENVTYNITFLNY